MDLKYQDKTISFDRKGRWSWDGSGRQEVQKLNPEAAQTIDILVAQAIENADQYNASCRAFEFLQFKGLVENVLPKGYNVKYDFEEAAQYWRSRVQHCWLTHEARPRQNAEVWFEGRSHSWELHSPEWRVVVGYKTRAYHTLPTAISKGLAWLDEYAVQQEQDAELQRVRNEDRERRRGWLKQVAASLTGCDTHIDDRATVLTIIAKVDGRESVDIKAHVRELDGQYFFRTVSIEPVAWTPVYLKAIIKTIAKWQVRTEPVQEAA